MDASRLHFTLAVVIPIFLVASTVLHRRPPIPRSPLLFRWSLAKYAANACNRTRRNKNGGRSCAEYFGDAVCYPIRQVGREHLRDMNRMTHARRFDDCGNRTDFDSDEGKVLAMRTTRCSHDVFLRFKPTAPHAHALRPSSVKTMNMCRVPYISQLCVGNSASRHWIHISSGLRTGFFLHLAQRMDARISATGFISVKYTDIRIIRKCGNPVYVDSQYGVAEIASETLSPLGLYRHIQGVEGCNTV